MSSNGSEWIKPVLKHRVVIAEENIEEIESRQDDMLRELVRLRYGMIFIGALMGTDSMGPKVIEILKTLIGL